jgi:hypothetical protein
VAFQATLLWWLTSVPENKEGARDGRRARLSGLYILCADRTMFSGEIPNPLTMLMRSHRRLRRTGRRDTRSSLLRAVPRSSHARAMRCLSIAVTSAHHVIRSDA